MRDLFKNGLNKKTNKKAKQRKKNSKKTREIRD